MGDGIRVPLRAYSMSTDVTVEKALSVVIDKSETPNAG